MISASPPLFASAVAAAVAGAVFAAGVAASALAVGGVPVDCDSAAVVGAGADVADSCASAGNRSEEHTSELQSLMRISYAVFCLKKKNRKMHQRHKTQSQYQKHQSQTKMCI